MSYVRELDQAGTASRCDEAEERVGKALAVDARLSPACPYSGPPINTSAAFVHPKSTSVTPPPTQEARVKSWYVDPNS